MSHFKNNHGFYWAGIGSRETPLELKPMMMELSTLLKEEGGILRSGHAIGADQFFEEGVGKGDKEIFVIRSTQKQGHIYPFDFKIVSTNNQLKASQIAERHHSELKYMSEGPARDLLTRNVFQIMGKDLKTPVREVFCWTPEMSVRLDENQQEVIKDVSGGTGLAVRLALSLNLPVWHLGYPPHQAILRSRFNKKWTELEEHRAFIKGHAMASPKIS